MTRRVESLLEEARAGILRLEPAQALAAQQAGALLVDTRTPDEQREQGGRVPGAISHRLSVLPWRLDALPRDTRILLICRHGESSSLGAAWLGGLGFRDPGDVIGGFEAWAAAGLPVEPVD